MRNESDDSLFGQDLAGDRELIGLAEAAALAGETKEKFWFEANRHRHGVPCGLYPAWHGFPDENKMYTKDRAGRWVRCPRWRRGQVLAAIARRDAGSWSETSKVADSHGRQCG